MDNKYIKVKYLAREGLFGNNTYADLDYIPSGIASAGAHKFGENTDANGNSTETIRISLTGNSRYKDASVEKKVVLKIFVRMPLLHFRMKQKLLIQMI